MTHHITLPPGVGATFYGQLPRDLERNRPVVEASDLVCLHTAADATDVSSAALVRRINPQARVWLGLPANYLVGLAQRSGVTAAVHEAERVARVALDAGMELLELNGEGQHNGAKPGDWIPADPAEATRLARLAVAILEALRDALGDDCALGWTSHDMPGFRLPWREILSRVDVHAPQHYPAMAGVTASQRTLERRVAKSQGRWDALADRGEVPADAAPYGAKWSPYFQGHGHAVGALVWGLCEAPTARLWACPGSWSPEAVEALRLARGVRAVAGYGPGAIEKWQALHGLEADGAVGRQTLAAMRGAEPSGRTT